MHWALPLGGATLSFGLLTLVARRVLQGGQAGMGKESEQAGQAEGEAEDEDAWMEDFLRKCKDWDGRAHMEQVLRQHPEFLDATYGTWDWGRASQRDSSFFGSGSRSRYDGDRDDDNYCSGTNSSFSHFSSFSASSGTRRLVRRFATDVVHAAFEGDQALRSVRSITWCHDNCTCVFAHHAGK